MATVTHAECITGVDEWARMKCIFELVAHGVVAFRGKYGSAPDQNHAMRHCVGPAPWACSACSLDSAEARV